ncbi:Hypothetical protein NTJ_06288 [Nesidiocoris tenuis]|uniref:Uncharacterized protein n=1 Tax=Nesidiocoris tenuis TaxID=355587 RepID=A0ABN7AML5_9HEMI|nr:Hypothetical protein NTJ_06288 [Nesidiocoris tenuis]
MAQIQMLISCSVLLMFTIRTLTMPLGDGTDSSVDNGTFEQVLDLNFDVEPENSTEPNMPTFEFKPYCYLQKNDSGIITTVNITREDAGNDTYIGYEEICQFPTRRLSPALLASLAG